MYIVYQLILSSTTFLFASDPLIPCTYSGVYWHFWSTRSYIYSTPNSPINYPWYSSRNPIFCSRNVQSLSWSLSCLFSTLELTTALEIIWVLHWIKSFLNCMLYQASHFSKPPSLVISPSVCHSDFELKWYPYEPPTNVDITLHENCHFLLFCFTKHWTHWSCEYTSKYASMPVIVSRRESKEDTHTEQSFCLQCKG